MSLTKFTGAVNIISSLADKPAKTAQQLKGDFDTVGALLKEYINDHLTEELDSKISEFATKIQNNTSSLDNMLNRVYPVGSIYMSVDNTNPTTLFGGTWIAWGQGKVPVGFNINETEFNESEKTGGEKVHTLTTGELPIHNHSLNNHTHSFSGTTSRAELTGTLYNMAVQSSSTGVEGWGIASKGDSNGGSVGYAQNSKTGSGTSYTDVINLDASHTHTYSGTTGQSGAGNTGNAGSGQAHNNLQPYITCYMWKRTA